MIVDTSAWVEYLRNTGSPTYLALRERVRTGQSIATPAPVVMELLAGCSTESDAMDLLQLLSRFEILGPTALADFEHAALIYRTCRRGGCTIRSMIDCMVAAVSLNEHRPLLAQNSDFRMIARHTQLELVAPEPGCQMG